MVKTVTQAMYLIFSTFIFLMALAYNVFTITGSSDSFDEVPASAQTVYNVQIRIPEEVYWTGAQVVGKLYRLTEDNVPIIVDSTTFNTDLDVMNKQHLVDLKATYKEEVTLDVNGNIARITFSKQ